MVIISSKPPLKVAPDTQDTPAQELAHFLDYEARAGWLSELSPELLQKYPGKYVALTPGWELLVADTMDELAAQVDQQGGRDGAAWAFLNIDRRRPRRHRRHRRRHARL